MGNNEKVVVNEEGGKFYPTTCHNKAFIPGLAEVATRGEGAGEARVLVCVCVNVCACVRLERRKNMELPITGN